MNEGNLGTYTNNRLESINSKIKQVIPKNSSLVDFIKLFFEWLHSINFETDAKVAKMFLKQKVNSDLNIIEQQYKNILSQKAFDLVQCEIREYTDVNVLVSLNKNKDVCLTDYNDIYSQTTALHCTCDFFESYLLPCKHIFSFRHAKQLPLFCEELCSDR